MNRSIITTALLLELSAVLLTSGVAAKPWKFLGRQQLRRRFEGATSNPGPILAEDEGYWERFLQNEVTSITNPPTPSPGTCVIEVNETFCAIDSQRKSFFFLLVHPFSV